MIYLDEATKGWKLDGIWKIAPAGLPWIKAGARASIGDGSRIGEGVIIGEGAIIGAAAIICKGSLIGEAARIGEWARIGEGASIGEGARIGDGSRIGAATRIGERARIGAAAIIGQRAIIGEGARIGPKSTEAIDLGWADGYRKCIAQVDGVAYIGAGCRWFTLDEAIAHWSGKEDRILTMCLMQSAVSIAGYKGWAFGWEGDKK